MAIQNNLNSSSIRKYLPSKVITGYSQEVIPLESWLYDDGYGDPWWQGATAAACRWILKADVFSVNHSSHLTRVPLMYNGLDIAPGMWVYGDGDQRAVRVVSVLSVTEGSIECIVEDVDRYNTFSDPNGIGTGIFSPFRNLIFFELGDDGLPVLNPLPANTDIATVSQVEARFRVFNPVVENRFFQLNHGFKEGQVLKINSSTGLFENASADDLYLVGTVVSVGPGPNYFYLAPSTKIIGDLEPGLPGNVGDVIWLDATTGDRTTTQNGSMNPLYIKMTKEVQSFTVSSVENPVVSDGTVIKLNNHQITFEGVASTSDLIDQINTHTAATGVVASMGSTKTEVTGSAMYPSSTVANMKFTVNDVLIDVNQPSINFGTSGDFGWWDVVRGINEQTFLHGVYATFDANTGYMGFQSANGENIVFTNVEPSVTSGAAKTFTDMVGVPLVNNATTANRLKLTRADGGAITITDVVGSFSYETGIQSADNGVMPLALVVDKSMMSNQNFVVADIAARDALTNLRTGDQVFVQSAGDGEWALFVRTGSTWTKISDYDSARTDAATISSEIAFDTATPVVIGDISSGSRVVSVSIKVTTAFDSANAVVSVGTSDNPTAIIGTQASDLTHVGTYEITTSYTYTGEEDGEVVVYLDAGGAAAGAATVLVSYL